MKLTIDQMILDKYNITLEEFLVLYLSAKEVDIKSLKEKCLSVTQNRSPY